MTEVWFSNEFLIHHTKGLQGSMEGPKHKMALHHPFIYETRPSPFFAAPPFQCIIVNTNIEE